MAGEPIQVFLLGGQSNMLGVGHVTDLPPALATFQPGIRFFYYGPIGGDPHPPPTPALLPLTVGSGNNGGQFGPELLFGRALSAAFPQRRFALIKYASGGTDLAFGWSPDRPRNQQGPDFEHKGHMLANFLATVQDGLDALVADDFEPEIAGMLWLQGERDSNDPAKANAYRDNLEAFIAHVRDAYDDDDLPFLIAGIRGLDAQDGVVLDAQQAVAVADPHVVFFPADGLSSHDPEHFDAGALVGIGRSFAAAWASLFPSPGRHAWISTADRGDGEPGLGADAFVLEAPRDASRGNGRDFLRVRRNPIRHETTLLRFDLSQAQGLLLDAGLLVQATHGTDLEIAVYGLLDGDPDELWPGDAVLHQHGVGMDEPIDGDLETIDLSADEVLDPATARVRALGTFRVRQPGLAWFESPGLRNLLRSDTNGVVTLLLEMKSQVNAQLVLASAEAADADPTRLAPSLVLRFASWACSDGVDNDGDGLTDHPLDPDCADDTGTSER